MYIPNILHKSLKLQNFQSHKKTKLELSEGVNVIVGATDSGKSAIIRALRWLVWNRPTGEGFRSTWGGKTLVEITSDNTQISRSKDVSTNMYILDTSVYEAFGTDVPKEIADTLNINEINLQQQLDSPFLLSSSPGEVAQHFNRIAHLDQIDEGNRNVQKWIREINSAITHNEEQLEGLEVDLKKYEHLNKLETDIEVLEEMQRQMITKVTSKNKLQGIIHDLQEINSAIDQLELITEAEEEVDRILELVEQKKEKNSQLTQLQQLIDNIDRTKRRLERAEEDTNQLQEEFDEAFPDVCPLCGQEVKK